MAATGGQANLHGTGCIAHLCHKSFAKNLCRQLRNGINHPHVRFGIFAIEIFEQSAQRATLDLRNVSRKTKVAAQIDQRSEARCG